MKNTYIECTCESPEHNLRLSYFDDDKDMIYVTTHLSILPFFKRLVCATKYVFGYQSKYGHFAEFVWTQENTKQFIAALQKFLEQP